MTASKGAKMHSKESTRRNRVPRKLIPRNPHGGAFVSDLTALFENLVRVETRLYNAVDDRLRSTHGMSVGQYELLRIIGSRESCRVLDIVREVAITVGAASKAVDRLEAAGWCRRSANPDDRRSSLLALTAAGERLLAEAAPTFEAELAARLVGPVTRAALDRLTASLATLRIALEHDGAGGRG
jgi:DNA-binding MarR family transcriptional regulator